MADSKSREGYIAGYLGCLTASLREVLENDSITVDSGGAHTEATQRKS